jgi:hypothetical protein
MAYAETIVLIASYHRAANTLHHIAQAVGIPRPATLGAAMMERVREEYETARLAVEADLSVPQSRSAMESQPPDYKIAAQDLSPLTPNKSLLVDVRG